MYPGASGSSSFGFGFGLICAAVGCCAWLLFLCGHGRLESANAIADSLAQFGQLLRPEDEQGDSENQQQVRRRNIRSTDRKDDACLHRSVINDRAEPHPHLQPDRADTGRTLPIGQ